MYTYNFTTTSDSFSVIREGINYGTWDKEDDHDSEHRLRANDSGIWLNLFNPGISFFVSADDVVQINGVEQTGTPRQKLSKLRDEVFFYRGGATEVVVLKRKTVLTDAQIKALPTTGIEVVPAPGANKFIIPNLVTIVLKHNGDYTNIDASADMGVYYYNTGFQILSKLNEAIPFAGVSGVLAAGDSSFSILTLKHTVDNSEVFGLSGELLSNVVNDSLYFYLDNMVSGNLTGGDSENALEVTVFYSIVDL